VRKFFPSIQPGTERLKTACPSGSSAARFIWTPTLRIGSTCCAYAEGDQTVATLPTSSKNSRRRRGHARYDYGPWRWCKLRQTGQAGALEPGAGHAARMTRTAKRSNSLATRSEPAKILVINVTGLSYSLIGCLGTSASTCPAAFGGEERILSPLS
jgi:hypothetical protein